MKSFLWLYLSLIVAVHARSACDDVEFVDRNGWGANPPKAITNLTRKPLSYYVIHHTYQPASCYDDATCIDRVKSIQRSHQIGNGWDDIGYHFLVGENGKVYEGRGWDRQGAHSPGWNSDAFGICIIGDFTNAPPNQKAQDTARAWIGCGIERGHVTPVYYIITHRQSLRPGYTECPGDQAFNAIKTWPRFCSFQNSGANLTANETLPAIARDFCFREIGSSACSPLHLMVFSLLLSLLPLYFI